MLNDRARPTRAGQAATETYLPYMTEVAVMSDHVLRLLFSDSTVDGVTGPQSREEFCNRLTTGTSYPQVTLDTASGNVTWPGRPSVTELDGVGGDPPGIYCWAPHDRRRHCAEVRRASGRRHGRPTGPQPKASSSSS